MSGPRNVAESMRLFHVDAIPEAEPAEVLSYTRRLTIRRRNLLDSGIHPATRLPLREDRKYTCWSCARRTKNGNDKRTYHKCEVAGVTNGPATDIRLSWPACTAYRPAGFPDPQQKLPPDLLPKIHPPTGGEQ